jgi:glycosyltransferase involved in cell wall biosynthesis
LLLPQLQFLQRAGYRVRLACAGETNGWGSDLAPFAPVELAFPREVVAGPLARAVASLPAVLREVQPDLLHLHSPAAALPARLVPRRLLPPQLKIAYTVHGFAHAWDEPNARDRVLALLERLLAPRAELMLFQSAEDYEHALAHRFRTTLRLLGNGVEDYWFDLPDPVWQPGPTVLFVGRLVREKGILDLLQALRSIPDVRLLIAGAALDSDRDSVEDEVQRLAAHSALSGRVDLLGMLSRDELRATMGRAQALVLPSYREGVPRSVIEALAAGRPAVVTDIRGCRELVQDGINGFVVPAASPSALAAALGRLAALNASSFQRLSLASRASVDPGRRESHVFTRLVAAYAELGLPP